MEPSPDDRPTEAPSLVANLKEIQHYASLVLLIASLPTLTLPGLAAKLLHVEEVVGLWELVVATAPLTLAVAAVGVYALSDDCEFGALVGGTAVALLGSLILGEWLGRDLPINPQKTPTSVLPFVWAMLSGYFRMYGAWSFATSFLVGGFLAWAWSRKLDPLLDAIGRGKPA